MKTFILHLSSYVRTDQNKAMAEFVKLGVPKWEMLLHWFTFPSFLESWVMRARGPSLEFLFDELNKSNISVDQFRAHLRNKFSSLTNKTDLQIDAAWNAMCVVTDFTMAAFDEVAQLHDAKNINIVFMSNTNRLHHDAITAQYGNKIPGDEPAFSHISGLKKTGPQFINDYINLIKEIPDQDIFVVYTPPPALSYPKLGALNWLVAPLATWAASKGQNYVSKLQTMASSGQFTLVSSQQTAAQPNIGQTLRPHVEEEFKTTKQPEFELTSKTPQYTPSASADNTLHVEPTGENDLVPNPRYREDGSGKSKVKYL